MTQAEFYNSRKWRRLSRAFLASRNYICERCGKPADIAHHKTRLTPANVNNTDISLNAARLEALCLECHNIEHYGAGGAILRGLEFTPEGDIRKEQLHEIQV
jgi:5-methylcytosine-specific restriction endonuclease McrA